jgi:diguanylate cyclase (GGDEF)-like protein
MSKKEKRIMLLVSLLLIFGFLATSLASYFVSLSSLRKEIEENALPLTSDNIYSEIQRDLLRPIFISSLMASDTFVRDWVLDGEKDPERMIRYLKEIQAKYNTFTCFFVSEKTRIYYQTNGILKRVQSDDPRDHWYFRVRQMQPDHEINVDPDMANRDAMTIFINYKVYDYAGNYIGATGVGLTVNAVKTLIDAYQSRYDRDIFFVDRQGNVALSSIAFEGMGSRLQEMEGLQKMADRIIHADQLTLSYEREGDTVHLNTRHIKEFDWILLVEQTEAAAIRQVNRALLVNLAICALITTLVLFIMNRALSGYQRTLKILASTDHLTGALTRNAFDSLFSHARLDCQRTDKSLSMILFDLDNFKKINDTFGHLAGDAVLQEISRRAREVCRAADMFLRWGGEEFLLLLPACDEKNAFRVAEKLRKRIESPPLHFGDLEIWMTASFGVTQYIPGEDVELLFARVDQALYTAKSSGRNRTEISPSPALEPAC